MLPKQQGTRRSQRVSRHLATYPSASRPAGCTPVDQVGGRLAKPQFPTRVHCGVDYLDQPASLTRARRIIARHALRQEKVNRSDSKGLLQLWCAALLLMQSVPGAGAEMDALRSGVVKIVSTDQNGKKQTGTGFIVKVEKDATFILTAFHVVEGDKTPQVEFFTRQNTPIEAEVRKTDERVDAALLVVRGEGNLAQPLRLNPDHTPTPGESLIAIGFPPGLGPWAVTKLDVASQVGIEVTLSGVIGEGSSGGPVLRDGSVVAMVTSTERLSGRATPAQFLAYALRGWGIELGSTPSSEDLAPPAADAELARLEAELAREREANASAASSAYPLSWRDSSLRYAGTLVADTLTGTFVIRAEVSDLHSGRKIGTFEVSAIPILAVSATEVVLTATFSVQGDSTTPIPHTHTSNLLFQEQPDGSTTLIRNCVTLTECYPASGRVVER